MEPASETINVAEFFSVLIQLAETGGKIIREVWESGDLNRVEKDQD